MIKDGNKKRSSRLLEDVLKDIKDRNKLIRLEDKSSGGWATVMEDRSDSIASNNVDKKKMRAAEQRAIAKMKHKKNLDIRLRRPTDAKKSTKVEPLVGLPTEEINDQEQMMPALDVERKDTGREIA